MHHNVVLFTHLRHLLIARYVASLFVIGKKSREFDDLLIEYPPAVRLSIQCGSSSHTGVNSLG